MALCHVCRTGGSASCLIFRYRYSRSRYPQAFLTIRSIVPLKASSLADVIRCLIQAMISFLSRSRPLANLTNGSSSESLTQDIHYGQLNRYLRSRRKWIAAISEVILMWWIIHSGKWYSGRNEGWLDITKPPYLNSFSGSSPDRVGNHHSVTPSG